MSEPYLVSLLGQLPDQSSSLNSLLLSLEAQARVLLDKIGKASANGSVPKSGKSTEKVTDKTSDDKLARSVQMFPQMLQLVSNVVVLKCSNVTFGGGILLWLIVFGRIQSAMGTNKASSPFCMDYVTNGEP